MDKYTKDNEVKLKEVVFEDDFVEEIDICDIPFNKIYEESYCDGECLGYCDECNPEYTEDCCSDCFSSKNKKKVILGAGIIAVIAGGVAVLLKKKKKKEKKK